MDNYDTFCTVAYKEGWINTTHNHTKHCEEIEAEYARKHCKCASMTSAKRWITKQMKKEYTK